MIYRPVVGVQCTAQMGFVWHFSHLGPGHAPGQEPMGKALFSWAPSQVGLDRKISICLPVGMAIQM